MGGGCLGFGSRRRQGAVAASDDRNLQVAAWRSEDAEGPPRTQI